MNDARRTSAWAAGGIALGALLVVVGAVRGLAGGAPPGGSLPNQATETPADPSPTDPTEPTASASVTPGASPTPPTPTLPAGTGEPTDEPTTTATAMASEPTPEPGAVALEPCRVVAEGLAATLEGSAAWAWADLQNVGSAPVTLSALQAAWGDAGALEAVLLDLGSGTVELFSGGALSPAAVGLRAEGVDEQPTLSPGASARVGLRIAAEATLPDIGPTVLHLREGCAVALHRSEADRCALESTDIRPSGNDPKRMVLSVRNRSASPTELRALDVYWPHSVNGRLEAIVLGGDARYRVDDGAETSPAALRLERLTGEAVVLAPGAALAIWLEFEKPVAERPYVVTAVAADGCRASATTWLDAPGCGTRASGFETLGLRARLRVANALPAPQTLSSLDLFWPAGVNGALVGVQIDGQPIWTGRASASPASLVFANPPPIGAFDTVGLDLVFAPSSPGPTPSVPDGGTISGHDYTLVLGWRGGCRLVHSTLRGPVAGCSVAAGSLAPRPGAPEAEVSLTNTGGDARLRRLLVSWPARNGALTSVRFGSDVLFEGRQEPSAEPFGLLPAPGTGWLRNRSTVPLVLRFETRASRTGYALSLSFEDADGMGCADLVVTPSVETGCDLAVTGVDQEAERLVDAFVRNNGEDEVELSFVNVDWPTEVGRNRLQRVLLLDGDIEYPLWTGEARQSPARIPLDGERAAVIDPAETVRVRLQFNQLGNVPDPAAVLKLGVGTVEGCQAFYPSGDRDTRPERASFSGVLMGLPEDGLWGWWTIEAQMGATRETRRVLVKSATLLEPATVRPAVGAIVRVEALSYDDGWHAERIAFRSFDQRIQLLGRIVDLDRTAPAGGRPAWIQLQSYMERVWIVADTYVDGRLDVGTQVTVLGTLDARGTVTAIEVKVQQPTVGEIVTVRGVVQAARQAPELGESHQVWTVGKYVVRVDTRNPATRLENPRARLAQPGERLEIRGSLSGNVIEASRVATVSEARVIAVSGALSAVPPGSLVGNWTVRRDEGGEVQFAVASTAVVDTRSAPAVVGVRIHAVLEDGGAGRWTALAVRTDWPE